jgi:S1-C subfamily serine protease
MNPRIAKPLLLAAGVLFLCASAKAEERPLQKMQTRLQALFKRVAPSVVGVMALTPSERLRARFGLPKAPKTKGAAERKVYIQKLEEAFRKLLSSGTGFVYDRQGHLVTSTRAVPPSISEVLVIFNDGTVEKAKVVGRAEAYNVVLLKVSRRDLKPVTFGGEARLGQTVVSVGNVFDIAYRMRRFAFSVGTVTGRYNVKAGEGFTTFYNGPVIETDAAINPGIFGGPLFDLEGRVTGMLSSTFAYQRFLGTAVPADRVRRGVEAILHPARVVGPSFDFPALGVRLDWKGGKLTIAAVKPGGLAAKAGFETGDIVLLIEDAAPTLENVPGLLEKAGVRGKVEFLLRRKGWEKSFVIPFRAPNEDDDDDF